MFATMHQSQVQGFCDTPPLWTNAQFGVTQFEFPKIEVNEIGAITIPERLRLGHQMEFVFGHLLKASPNWELLANNLLVDEGKVRIGELDFLLKDIVTATVFHIELAYKFYIVNPEISAPMHRLMGPNRRDMFFTKLDKLKTKQFPLLFHKSLSDRFRHLNIDLSEVNQQACFKAQLFTPFNQPRPSIRPLNIDCIAGSWVRFDAFSGEPFKDYQYYIPFKKEWVLSPVLERPYSNHYETLMEVNLRMIKQNAPMLWGKKPSGDLIKLFVVWW